MLVLFKRRSLQAKAELCGAGAGGGPCTALGAPNQEFGQQRHRPAGCTLGIARYRVGSGDIEVGPLEVVGKTLEEASRGDSTSRTAANVAHVGEIALEQILVLVKHR